MDTGLVDDADNFSEENVYFGFAFMDYGVESKESSETENEFLEECADEDGYDNC